MGFLYQIVNIHTSATYIGSTTRNTIKQRWYRHRTDLRKNRHHNIYFQRAWNKYGENAFVFTVISQIPNDKLLKEEQKLLDYQKTLPTKLNYNLCFVAGNAFGTKRTIEQRKRISEAHKGIRPSEASKIKQKLAWAAKCKILYSFTSPDGVVYQNIKNLREFARQHNLHSTQLGLVWKKICPHHKNWTKTGEKRKFYVITSPEGRETQTTNLKKFCEQRELDYKMIHQYNLRLQKPYRGWSVKSIFA